MANNKANFLKILLNQPTLTNTQYNRINKLLGMGDNMPTGVIKATPYHYPKETADFLTLFSSNDGGLKNLTHAFDGEIVEYEEFMSNCEKQYKSALQKYPNVKNQVLGRINQFAFSDNPNWYIRTSHKDDENIPMTTGWRSPDFIKWYKKTKKHPYDDVEWRTKMVNPFKESIQVRTDTGTLKRILSSLSDREEINNLEIKIDKSIESANFYTDVDMLTKAISLILVECSKLAAQNFQTEVIVRYEEATEIELKKLYIIHTGSSTKKNAQDKKFVGGNFNAIIKCLTGICNYDIESVFGDGKFRKSLLFDESIESDCVKLEDDYQVIGFTHILKFY